MKEVSLKNLKLLIEKEGKIMVSFGAKWCGQTIMSKKIINELKKEYKHISFFYVDVDQNHLWQEDDNSFKIVSTPTYIMYENSNKKNTISGFQTKEELEVFIKLNEI